MKKDPFAYEDMPTNEQRLDYLDNPRRVFYSIKDWKKVVTDKRYYEKTKTRVGLLQDHSEEDEVSHE
jgi:hypothetical protein